MDHIANSQKVNKQLAKLKTLYTESGSRIRKASKLARQMVTENPSTYALILNKLEISKWTLDRMLKLGAGKIIREIMFDNSNAAACLEMFPVQVQKDHHKNGFNVVRKFGKEYKVVNRPLEVMTTHDCKRAFDLENVKMRTPEQQIEYLKTRKTKVQLKNKSFDLNNNRLNVYRPHNFSLKKLTEIIEILAADKAVKLSSQSTEARATA